MSLVRLLTAGKSLMGVKEPEIRYRMRKQNLLPKFGSGKNPFADRSEPSPAQSSVPANPPPESAPAAAPVQLTAAEQDTANLKETGRLPAPSSKRESRDTSETTAPTRARNRVPSAVQKLNPLAWWSNRKPAARRSTPKPGKPPVQGELSLDNIKVVRNDLNEADVEIQTARPEAATPAVPTQLPATKNNKPASTGRDRLAGRV